MAGKTKATTKGSPVEIKEIKRIIHNAISEAGGQCYQPGGRFLVAFSRRGYFLRNSSSANFLSLVCDAFDSSSHVFPRLILFSIKREAAFLFSDESMGLLPVCCSTMASMSSWCCSCRKNFSSSGGKSILISCTAERRSTSHHGADGCYSFYGVREAKADRYRFLGEINRRGYLSRNASSANRFGLVRGEGLSKDSRSRRTFRAVAQVWIMRFPVVLHLSLSVPVKRCAVVPHITAQVFFMVVICVMIQVALRHTA